MFISRRLLVLVAVVWCCMAMQQALGQVGDEYWSDRFGGVLPFNRPIDDLIVDGGRLIAVGPFFHPHSYGAAWDGAAWQSLGLGQELRGTVRAVAVHGMDVYVAGEIGLIDGPPVRGVAHWDGTQWRALGEGVAGVIRTLVAGPTGVYVGGLLHSAGGKPVRNLAWWDGAEWRSMGDGVDDMVYTIAVHGPDVYVGGRFKSAGGLPVRYIARWDGADWQVLGDGVDAEVIGIETSGNDVYVLAHGHPISEPGGPDRGVLRWDDTTWTRIGGDVAGFRPNVVAANGADLYVGGDLVTDGRRYAHVMRWDGGAWRGFGTWERGEVRALAALGPSLYVGGSEGGLGSGSMFDRWDGVAWQGHWPNGGADGLVDNLAAGDGVLYAARWVTDADGRSAYGLFQHNEDGWHALGGSFDRKIESIVVVGNDLYAGGEIWRVGSQSFANVVRWDGVAWHDVGGGVDGEVEVLTVSGSDLYAGGSFSTAGGAPARNVARWDGTTWHPLGDGVDGQVTALAVRGKDVFVGGSFSTAGGAPARNVARWDGVAWHTFGEGLSDPVQALAVSGPDLFAGSTGYRRPAGQDGSLGALARWNGETWQPVGDGIDGWVATLALVGGELYAGGTFRDEEGQPYRSIDRWSNEAWRGLGSGTNGIVHSLTVSGTMLYVGGQFTQAGGRSSNYVGAWEVATPAAPVLLEPRPNASQFPEGEYLAWAPFPGAVGYDVEIAAAPDFSGDVHRAHGVAGSSYTPDLVDLGDWFYWRVRVAGEPGPWSEVRAFKVVLPTGRDEPTLPGRDLAFSVYPSPFVGAASIGFDLPVAGRVNVEVVDVLGRLVARPAARYVSAGRHEVRWEAGGAPAGVYFVRLQVDGRAAATTVVLHVR